MNLQVPTADLPHQIDGLLSIDQIAVPTPWPVVATERHPAFAAGSQLSDHAVYMVDVGENV